MKFLLVAINAKYIHSNLAVYSLKEYGTGYSCTNHDIQLREYTINQYKEEILQDIYNQSPDVLCFSCYIWNIQMVKETIKDYKKINPDIYICLGGPEVSYNMEEVLNKNLEVDLIMYGEGEEIFKNLLNACKNNIPDNKILEKIKGIAIRKQGHVLVTPPEQLLDLSTIPFVYKNMKDFENKIIYYETSRGCPFSCSYCLSSVDKQIRFRSMKLIKEEIKFFIDNKVSQVKFVDRTFNCNPKRTVEILTFIKENDNDITNFHFEIAANLITKEELEIMKNMRPKLIQLETGVQSTNMDTINAINRKTDFSKIYEITKKIKSFGNIHQHLDLIAGLPFENYESFKKSFNMVYELQPDQLQLGFLKVLHGSAMEENSGEYGLVYSSMPPYEVIKTNWLSYKEVLDLKKIENVVEIYYNSFQFEKTMVELKKEFDTAFEMYEELGKFYYNCTLKGEKHSRVNRYNILLDFINENVKDYKKYIQLLTFDFYLRENAKTRPEFSKDLRLYKKEIRNFFNRDDIKEILPEYADYENRQIIKMTHIEVLETNNGDNKFILFNYMKKNPLNNQAQVKDITKYIDKIRN